MAMERVMSNPSKEITGAKFQEVTDPLEDWEVGMRVWACEADEVEDLRVYAHKGSDPAVQGLSDFLTVQWEAHDRLYRATFGLGLVCEVRAAAVEHSDGVVRLAIPSKPECVPERLEQDD